MSSSSLSDKSFITTIVELNATISPTYIAVIWLNPRNTAIRKPNMKVSATCNIPPNVDTRLTVFNFLRSISNPTMKSKNAIPISENAKINSVFLINPNIRGPIIKPTATYAGISGCFNILAINAKIVHKIRIIAMSKIIASFAGSSAT